jgi:hypothetical protein
MAVVLGGFSDTLPIFHGSDELVYHLPTILQFGRQLPFPDLQHYPAAQTPLFHLILAVLGRTFGFSLWKLRLAQVVISYLLTLAVLRLLRRIGTPALLALLLTLLFALSPYVFGQSFRLGTDNLALLFGVMTLERLEAFRHSARTAHFAQASVFIALALLARQSTAYLLPMGFVYAVWTARSTPRRLSIYLGMLAVACTPTVALFISWHALVPIGSDPSSCGLCSTPAGLRGSQPATVNLTTAELWLATIGIYGAVLFGLPRVMLLLRASTWRSFKELVPNGRWIVGPVLIGLVLLAAVPARFSSHGAGDIWKLAHKVPVIDGSSALFWVTVPLALVLLSVAVWRAPRPMFSGVLIVSLLLSLLVVRFPWQKYVDPYALLVLVLLCKPDDWTRPLDYLGLAVLMLAFIGYAADSNAHRDVRPPKLVRGECPRSCGDARRLLTVSRSIGPRWVKAVGFRGCGTSVAEPRATANA